MHDDQHGTAVICLAAVINGLKMLKKEPKDMKLVINGAGYFKIINIQSCRSSYWKITLWTWYY